MLNVNQFQVLVMMKIHVIAKFELDLYNKYGYEVLRSDRSAP